MDAPSDLHFLFVWCTWVEEGHYNGSLWSSLCAGLTLWVSGGASYVLVGIANAGGVEQSVFLYCLLPHFGKYPTDLLWLVDLKRFVTEIFVCITPFWTSGEDCLCFLITIFKDGLHFKPHLPLYMVANCISLNFVLVFFLFCCHSLFLKKFTLNFSLFESDLSN